MLNLELVRTLFESFSLKIQKAPLLLSNILSILKKSRLKLNAGVFCFFDLKDLCAASGNDCFCLYLLSAVCCLWFADIGASFCDCVCQINLVLINVYCLLLNVGTFREPSFE